MSYVCVPVGNMLLEHMIKLGDAILFPCYYFAECAITDGVTCQDEEYIRRLYYENQDYYEDLARYGLCMLLFETEDAAEMINNSEIIKNRILYQANRYLDYLIIQQCLYSRPEYLMNVAGQVGPNLMFDIIDENCKIQFHVSVGNKFYSMQPGLGLDVGCVTSGDKLFKALYSKRTDEVYNEYRAILGNACDAIRIGDINRCFSYLFTKVERMGHCDGFHFQKNKIRIISCLSKDQTQFDMYSRQLYFYSKRIRTDIVHKGINFLEQIPVKQAHIVINDLLLIIIQFCTSIIETEISSFEELNAYFTEQESKYQYAKPQETIGLEPHIAPQESSDVYAATIANMDLQEPIKVGKVIFLPKLSVFSFDTYYQNYVKKDLGCNDYDEVFEDFSAEELEYIVEILKHGELRYSASAIIFQQPSLPLNQRGAKGYEFLCDYICGEIGKTLGCFLLASNNWRKDWILPSKVGVVEQIRTIWRYDEKTGELQFVPGRVYQGYFEPPMSYTAPDSLTISRSVMCSIFFNNEVDVVTQMCKTALERVCASYYMDNLNLRIIYLFDILDMLYPDTTNGEDLRKRVLSFVCSDRKAYEEQTEIFRNIRKFKRNPIIHGGKSIYDLVDNIDQIHTDCNLLERWIRLYCSNVIQLNISTMEELNQASRERRNSFV